MGMPENHLPPEKEMDSLHLHVVIRLREILFLGNNLLLTLQIIFMLLLHVLLTVNLQKQKVIFTEWVFTLKNPVFARLPWLIKLFL